MDFAFTPEQEALRDLARSICQDHATHDRLKAVERDPDGIDRELWTALAQANLLGVALPESVGGSGLGLVELCLLLEQVGAAVAPVPVWPTLVLGALPVARVRQRRRSASAGCRASRPATPSSPRRWWSCPARSPAAPATRAVRDGAGWRLDGVKDCVPAAHLAAAHPRARAHRRRAGRRLPRRPVAPRASRSSGRWPPTASRRRASRSRACASAPTPCSAIRRRGGAIVEWLVDRALLGLCALELGVVERALRITAQYTTERKQFDRPDRQLPGRAAARRRRLDRRRGDPPDDLAGRLAARRRAAGARRGARWRSSGRRRPGTASRTPRSTSTAASASTSTTRSTATTCGRRRSS